MFVDNNYQSGTIVFSYPEKQDFYFVFKAMDYKKLLLKYMQKTDCNSDDCSRLLDSLEYAASKKMTILEHGFVSIFPNNCIIARLLKQNLCFIISEDSKEKINYTMKIKYHYYFLNFKIIRSYLAFDNDLNLLFGCNCSGYKQVIIK